MKVKSSIVYRGPSLIDGKPIVAVAIISSANTKTGGMLQTYIMRADIDPRLASKSGEDFSICGSCPSRGIATNDPDVSQAKERACYVLLGQGPLIVWKSMQRNLYPDVTGHADIAAIGTGRMVRLGTYGDPAAVPSYIWDSLLSLAEGHTAYTHQSGMAGADVRHDLFMTSADTLADATHAWSQGRRTFRVVNAVSDIVKGAEILCPASKEAGNKTTCFKCGLCAGSLVNAKSIAIPAHGAGSVHIRNRYATATAA